MHGPIDYIVVGFEGNKFNGNILRALSEAIDKGIVSLVALSFIRKNAKGLVDSLDIAKSDDKYLVEFIEKYSSNDSLVSDEDIDEVSDLLDNNTAAGLLVVEQLWAKPLKQAVINANGVLVAEGRIHPEAAAELNEREEK